MDILDVSEIAGSIDRAQVELLRKAIIASHPWGLIIGDVQLATTWLLELGYALPGDVLYIGLTGQQDMRFKHMETLSIRKRRAASK